MSAAPAPSGSSPTPNTPSTSCPAATVQHPATVPRAGRTNLYVHLTPDDLAADLAGGTGAATIEKLGAATTRLLTDWLTRFAADRRQDHPPPRPRPQLQTAVDQHDPPQAMRETVILRDAHCVFPGCRRDSRACDLDHITDYLPHRRRRTTGPNPPRQPRTPVPHPPPRQDPLRLDLQTPRQRPLHLDQPHRPPIRRHPGHPPTTPTTPKNLTAHHPGHPQPRRGHGHADGLVWSHRTAARCGPAVR